MERLSELLTRLFGWLFKGRSFSRKNPLAWQLLAIPLGSLAPFVFLVIFMGLKKLPPELAQRKLPAGDPVQRASAQVTGLAPQGW